MTAAVRLETFTGSSFCPSRPNPLSTRQCSGPPWQHKASQMISPKWEGVRKWHNFFPPEEMLFMLFFFVLCTAVVVVVFPWDGEHEDGFVFALLKKQKKDKPVFFLLCWYVLIFFTLLFLCCLSVSITDWWNKYRMYGGVGEEREIVLNFIIYNSAWICACSGGSFHFLYCISLLSVLFAHSI